MTPRKFIFAIILAVAIVIACERLSAPKHVKASSDCPVQSVTQQGPGATVVFDCGAYIITIQEPVWP